MNYEICLVNVLKQTLRGVLYKTHTETALAIWGKNVLRPTRGQPGSMATIIIIVYRILILWVTIVDIVKGIKTGKNHEGQRSRAG